jgi:D-3-phosphoglycerate dehydrogenase
MRLGIVGLGRLGRKVAAIARAIGMEVAFYDPGKEGSLGSLKELAERSDVLSLHAPGNEQTRGLVDRRVLEALPEGAVLVNTARGELLDTEALLELMDCGHIAAAALDTIDGEYFPGFTDHWQDHPVAVYARSHDNLILTPHIGGSTFDAWTETERRVIEKVCHRLGLVMAT